MGFELYRISLNEDSTGSLSGPETFIRVIGFFSSYRRFTVTAYNHLYTKGGEKFVIIYLSEVFDVEIHNDRKFKVGLHQLPKFTTTGSLRWVYTNYRNSQRPEV